MPNRRSLLRRLKLRTVLVVALLLSGIIPLGISSYVVLSEARKVLADSERDNLTDEAKALSVEVDSYLAGIRRQLSLFGTSLLLAPGPEDATARLQEPWMEQELQSFHRGNPDLLAVRVLDLNGQGLSPGNLAPDVQSVMDSAFEKARTGRDFAYAFVALGPNRDPRVVLATPIIVKAA